MCGHDDIIVTLKNVTKCVEKGKVLLDDISLNIQKNALVAIIGPSGAGKSTLLQAMSGYEQEMEGEVIYFSKDEENDRVMPLTGYVPQENIIHDNLILRQMLEYAALLRLPKKTDKQEIKQRIHKVITDLELESCSLQLIKKLSGGEKKRANLAVELLSDPEVFLLDEPTSGLDIYTELSLVKTLKNLTSEGKTVVYVSHTPLELKMCDQVIVIGKGGKLCFSGSPDEMMEFFGSSDYLTIYQMLEWESERWQRKFKERFKECENSSGISVLQRRPRKAEKIHQFKILTARYSRLLLNDWKNLLLMFLQAPVLALALKIVTRDGLYRFFWDTQEMLFALVCVGIWMGLFNSLREICKERDIIKREYMNQISIGCCLGSKLAVLLAVCLVQSISLGICYSIFTRYPEKSILFSPLAELCISLFFITYASTCMGLLISSIFRNQDKVMSAAPYILIPQLLFSGVIYELRGFLSNIAKLIISYWGVNALSVSAHLTKLSVEEEVIKTGPYKGLGFAPAIPEKAYLQYTLSGLMENWLVLIMGCAFMIFLCYWAIRKNVNKNSRT